MQSRRGIVLITLGVAAVASAIGIACCWGQSQSPQAPAADRRWAERPSEDLELKTEDRTGVPGRAVVEGSGAWKGLRLVDAANQLPIPSVALHMVGPDTSGQCVSDENGIADLPNAGLYQFRSRSHGSGVLVVRSPFPSQPVTVALRRPGRAILDLSALFAESGIGDVVLTLVQSLDPLEIDVERSSRIVVPAAGPWMPTAEGLAGTWVVQGSGLGADERIMPERILLTSSDSPPTYQFKRTADAKWTITGRVVVPDGGPVADIIVRTSAPVVAESKTDSDGRFILRRAPGAITGTAAFLRIASDAAKWSSQDRFGPFQWGDSDVILELQPKRKRLLCVVDEQGRKIHFVAAARRRGEAMLEASRLETLEPGQVADHVLIPDWVEPDNWIRLEIGGRPEYRRLWELETYSVDAESIVHVYRRASPKEMRVLVVSEGSAIPGVAVDVVECPGGKLVALAAPRDVVDYDPSLERLGAGLARVLVSGVTDASGRASLRWSAAPNLFVRCVSPGYESVCVPVVGEGLESGSAVLVQLRRCYRFSGRLLGGARRVLLFPTMPALGAGFGSEVERDGQFEISKVVEGDYSVGVGMAGTPEQPGELHIVNRVQIRGGDLTMDIDASHLEAGSVVATCAAGGLVPHPGDLLLVFRDLLLGQQVPATHVVVGSGPELWRGELAPGTYSVSWLRGGTQERAPVDAEGVFDVTAGQMNRWSLAFRATPVAFAVRRGGDGALLGSRWFRAQNSDLLRSDAHGVLRMTAFSRSYHMLQPLRIESGVFVEDGPPIGPLSVDAPEIWLVR